MQAATLWSEPIPPRLALFKVYFIPLQQTSGLGIPVGNSRGILHQQCKTPLPRAGDLYSQTRNKHGRSSLVSICTRHRDRQLQLEHCSVHGLVDVKSRFIRKNCLKKITNTIFHIIFSVNSDMKSQIKIQQMHYLQILLNQMNAIVSCSFSLVLR
jgi:hypothetical protein